MKCRPIEPRDVEKAREIYEKYYQDDFFLPTLEECIICDSIEDENGELVAVSIVRPIFESIIIFDKDKPKRTIIAALREIFISGLAKLSSLGLDPNKIHAFLEDDGYASLLKKHFGFRKAKGECVVLRMNDG